MSPAETERATSEKRAPPKGPQHWQNVGSLHQTWSLQKRAPHPFWTIIVFRVMKPLLTSGQIQRYVLFPAVIPTCQKQAQRTGQGISLESLFAWEIEFLQQSIVTGTAESSFLGLPRIRRLRIGRPRKLAAMFPGTYTTPETSGLLARKRTREFVAT